MILELQDASTKIEEFRDVDPRRTVGVVSGGFDPIHPGHCSYIDQAAHLCDMLVVVVNGDWFLTQKKGRSFMPLADRVFVVDCLQGVKITVPFEIVNDETVGQALEILQPDYFFKGGDRTGPRNIPEWLVCETNDIEVITDCGDPKYWSSSDYLRRWESDQTEKREG